MRIYNKLSSASCSGDGLLDASLLLLLLGFGVADGLVDGEDGAGCLGGCFEGVDLDQQWLPDEGQFVVAHSVVDIDSHVDILLPSFI